MTVGSMLSGVPDQTVEQDPLQGQPATFLTEALLKRYANQDPGVWNLRDQRMWRHRKLYELRKPDKDKLRSGQVVAVTNDAKAIVRKLASMISNHPPKIEAAVLDPAQVRQGERVQDFLYWWRDEEEFRYGEGPNGSRAYAEAEYAVRDGMVVDVTTLDPGDPTWPWVSTLVDPMCVYPTYAGNKLLRVTIKYRTTIGEAKGLVKAYGLEGSIPDSITAGKRDGDSIDVTKVYSVEGGTWEFGLMIRNRVVIIQPLGYNPVTITYVASRMYSSLTQGDQVMLDRYQNVGNGIFDLIEEPIRNKNEDYSLMREMMARDANPPRVFFTNDEAKLDELTFNPGENVHLWSEDKFQLVQLTPDFRKIQALLSMDQQGIDRGTLPAALWGEGDANSAAQEFMQLGNARDQVLVYVRAMERFYAQKYRRVLQIYQMFSPALDSEATTPGVSFTSTTQTQGGKNILLAGQPFTVADIEALGPTPQIKVSYSDITPQNEAARANMAVSLTREKILDLHSAREMLPEPFGQRPEQIAQQVLQDISLMHPMMTQVMAMTAALLSPDPVMRSIASLMLPSLTQQSQTDGMQPPQPSGPGTAGGGQSGPNAPPPNTTPGQQGVPPTAQGLHPTANPPENGQNNGLPPGHTAVPPQGSQPR